MVIPCITDLLTNPSLSAGSRPRAWSLEPASRACGPPHLRCKAQPGRSKSFTTQTAWAYKTTLIGFLQPPKSEEKQTKTKKTKHKQYAKTGKVIAFRDWTNGRTPENPKGQGRGRLALDKLCSDLLGCSNMVGTRSVKPGPRRRTHVLKLWLFQ